MSSVNVIKLPPGASVDGVGKHPKDLVLVRNWMRAGERRTIHHPYLTFAIIQKGNVCEPGGARAIGDIHFHQPGAWEVQIGDMEAESFGGTFFEAILPDEPNVTMLDIEDQPSLGPANGLGAKLLTEYKRGDESSILAIQGLFIEILSYVSRHALPRETGHPTWLLRARDILEDSPTHSFSLEKVANECGINPAHLARTFRTRYGVSLGEYHRAVRLNFAYALLISSDAPIGEVATLAGFSDHAHFSRMFRSKSGLSPVSGRQTGLTPEAAARAFGAGFRTCRFIPRCG